MKKGKTSIQNWSEEFESCFWEKLEPEFRAEIKDFIRKAILQERERIVKSLRMEHEEPDIQAVRDVVTLNEGNVDFREVMDLEWLRIRYKNETIDELNKKIDELLK